jgi:hypothetical protein
MEIKVTINASPDLIKAIKSLESLIGGVNQTAQAATTLDSIQQVNPQPVQIPQQEQAPMYTPPMQQQPIQQEQPVYTQPIQQTPPVYNPPLQQPMYTQPPIQAQPLPTTAPTYTADQLAVAATQLVDAGKRMDVLNLIHSFGVQVLTDLPKEQYGNFATSLRGMGAKI